MIPRRLLLPAMLLAAAPLPAATPLLDLPAGALGEAVMALGRATGTSIAVDDPAMWQRQVPAIRGRLSAQQALHRLAAAAGADLRPAGANGWRLVRRHARPPMLHRISAPAPTPPQARAAGDIVVTASKRDVRLRDFAGQAAVLEGADLARNGAEGTDAILARLASVSSTHLGSGRNKLFIRGIADSSFTGPTQSTVGQYLGDLRLTYNAPDPDLQLYDIATVEVLEGPQGTLYGAGSLGGIIRIVPNSPRVGTTQGSATIGGSLTRHGDPGADAAAMLNLPVLGSSGALRLVGYGSSDGGYIDNPLRGERNINRTHIRGGRAALRLEPGDGWTIDLGGVGQRTHGDDSQYADRDGPRLTRSSAVRQGFRTAYALGQVAISKDWDILRLRVSGGIVDQRLRERYDASVPAGWGVPGMGPVQPEALSPDTRLSAGEPRLFVQRNRTRLLASEARLWRPMAEGFGWVLGASLTSNRTRLGRAVGLIDDPLPATGVVNRVDEATLYGEASVAPVPGLILTAGGRATHSRLAGGGEDVLPQVAAARAAITADRNVTSLLPSASVVTQVVPGMNLFVRYQEGFRPGGLAIESEFVRRFRSDRVATLEGGVRAGGAGSPTELQASISHTLWRDIQADFIDAAGLPSTANIGDGRIWTLSATGAWRPLPGLRLDVGFTLNNSRVTEPEVVYMEAALARMSRVPNVARHAGRIGFDYERPLSGETTVRLNGWARYIGRSRLGVGPVLGEEQGDYVDTALSARVGRDGWGVTLGLTNLADAIGNRFALGTPFPVGRGQITPLRPRTLRIGLDAAF